MSDMISPADVFDTSFDILMEFEGYISDDTHDAGGLTKYGISQKAYPDLDIATLTLGDARRIYKADYFDACFCSEFPALLAAVVFDTAVNMGTERAIKFLQSSVGTAVDGDYGPNSRKAVERAVIKRGTAEIVNDFMSHRAVFYAKLCERKPSQHKFLRGWLRRTYRLQQFLFAQGWS